MMRGDDRWAVAVRTPSGEIAVTDGDVPTWGRRWKKVPVVRGLVAIAEAAPLGAKAFAWSASHGLVKPRRRSSTLLRIAGLVAALWFVPPAITQQWLLQNVVAFAVLAGYAALVGRLSMLKTVFEYHGAEHKVVAAYEAEVDLTPEYAAVFSTRHVRCGTSLLLVIGVVGAAVSALHLPVLVAVPLVAGVAAELQLRAAANVHRSWVRTLVLPGLWLQRLTTRQPSLAQLEVAIAALQAATVTAAQPSSVDTDVLVAALA
jgi:uncharacterized protein YqhQ